MRGVAWGQCIDGRERVLIKSAHRWFLNGPDVEECGSKPMNRVINVVVALLFLSHIPAPP